MPWVKIYTEILDDPKLGELPAETKWCYVQLIVLAGDYDADGYIVTRDSLVTHANIAWRLRVTVETLTRDINLLCECGLVEIDHGAIFIPKFAERQGRKQSEKREQWRERQAKSREKHDSDVTRDSRVTHAPRGEERREEKEEEREEEKSTETAQAPAPSRPPNLLFDAIAEVTATNPKLMGARIGKCASQLSKIGATPEQVKQVAKWYQHNDWRGKKGERLTFALLIEIWDMGIRNVSNPATTHLNEPAGFAAIREAMADPRYQEKN